MSYVVQRSKVCLRMFYCSCNSIVYSPLFIPSISISYLTLSLHYNPYEALIDFKRSAVLNVESRREGSLWLLILFQVFWFSLPWDLVSFQMCLSFMLICELFLFDYITSLTYPLSAQFNPILECFIVEGMPWWGLELNLFCICWFISCLSNTWVMKRMTYMHNGGVRYVIWSSIRIWRMNIIYALLYYVIVGHTHDVICWES